MTQICISTAGAVDFSTNSQDPIDNKSALVQVMAWRGTGDKPLCEPMLTQFADAYMQH